MVKQDNGTDGDTQRLRPHFDRHFVLTNFTILHFPIPDFSGWLTKLINRASSYGFDQRKSVDCRGIRKGQHYCWSFEAYRQGGGKEAARADYQRICRGEPPTAKTAGVVEAPGLHELPVLQEITSLRDVLII